MFNELTSVDELLLKPLQHYGPVTGLKIYKNYVIAGYGPILKIFDQSKGFKLIRSEQAFKRNKIHAISVSKDGKKLFIAGGRSFAVVDLFNVGDTSTITEHAINEWVVCGEFLTEATLLVLTAHNIIYKIDVETYSIAEQIHCNEKSILYSGSICITEDNHVYIAAGTVMSGVLIWDFNTRKILYNLTEHEGSIFGVQIDSKAQYIISCSDDRSIKLYDFTSGTLLGTGWGHGSRIWNLGFYEKKDANVLGIFSTGEDCTARLWEYDIAANTDLLSLVKVMDCHLGKHVWSGDIVGGDIAVTGGADGRIVVHDISTFENTTSTYSVTDLSKTAGAKFEKNELIRQFVELPKLNLLVILTSNGQFFSLNQTTNEWKQLEVSNSDIFKSFGIMKCFVEVNVVFVAARDGTLLTMRFQDEESSFSHTYLDETNLSGNKMVNLLCASNPDTEEYHVLVDCPNPKAPLVLRTFTISGTDLPVLKSTSFLKQQEQLTFTITSLLIDSLNNWLILGSKYVSIAVYDLTTRNEEGSIVLGKIFKKLSVGDTISSVTCIKSCLNTLRICVTVKDGVYMYIDITKKDGEYSLDIIHHNKISKGFVEGGFIENNDLILYGFKSSYFYVYNESQQLEITSELCGGPHRQWEFLNYQNNSVSKSQYKFIYTHKSAVHVMDFQNRFKSVLDSGNIINYGTHGREIRDVAVSLFEDNHSDGSRLILTASEDTIVRLGRIYSSGEVKSYWCLNGHISGMQKVKFLSKEFAASSAANEEFCLWKINQTGGEVPTVTEYSRLKPTSSNPDLRIMDFDSIPRYANDGETIIGFVFCTVYSDSMINIWHYNVSEKTFTLIIKGQYTTCCILNVNFLKLDGRTLLMTGATDGHLALWDITTQLNYKSDTPQSLGQVIVKQQLHQSGIKALSLLTQSSDIIEIVTGGDDNALILSNISISTETGEISVETKSFVEKAASTTITSISNIDDSNIIVTSVDQIVRTWSILKDKELSCTSARYTTIADTGCSDVINLDGKNIAVIGGAGLSTWECK